MRRIAPTTMSMLSSRCAVSLACTVLALAPLAGCGKDADPESSSAQVKDAGSAAAEVPADVPAGAEAVSLSADSARGNFQIRIRPEGGSIPLNEPFSVLVDLLDPATGERLGDYDTVTLDARMPAHGHGMLRDVALVPAQGGSLRADGLLFHMVGHWEFHVDLTRGPRVERAQASFELTL